MAQVKPYYKTANVAAIGGLMGSPKTLPSWLFYDESGDKIFQEIMRQPEYYLTRTEYEIIHSYKDDLLKYFSPSDKRFQLIELGAGDGLKTEVLLKYFVSRSVDFVYTPVDLSPSILQHLQSRLN